MADYDELPLPSRTSDTKSRAIDDQDTDVASGPTVRQSPELTVGGYFGDFQLVKLLGKGSTGFVFRAIDTVSQRSCALKLISSEPAENLLRIKLGFRRMMQIEHPHLARALRIHQAGGQLALSMEEIHGDTLANHLRQMRLLPRQQACNQLLSLLRDYASGLAAIHSHGFLHRDIKPQNLMVDNRGRGHIIDYGLVGTFDAEGDSTGFRNYLIGTPGYFAPEALAKQCYLPAGDVYSLGCVMLEAMRVITGDTRLTPLDELAHDNAATTNAVLREWADSVPEVLREACHDMLQPFPGDRPTAMQIARYGLSMSLSFSWPHEKPIYGRQAELATLHGWIKSIYSGATGRIHLYGVSGIGKTRLIDEVEKYLHSRPYVQVFRARCRTREDLPFQAFDQIADQLANRYRRKDLQRCRLDPASASILLELFPVLKNAIEVRMDLPTPSLTTTRLDALEAASRISVEIRKNGPLILIIDDVQWADPDSLAVLDRLCDAPGGSLGMITISRSSEDHHQRASDMQLELKGLGPDDAARILTDAAHRWSVKIDAHDAQELADFVDGVPFRLAELAQEFRPGGLLSTAQGCQRMAELIAAGQGIDWICEQRVERLSPAARRILLLIVAAGRAVSTAQLDSLTGLEEPIEAPLSELVQQHFVCDDAHGTECIRMVHDRISDRLNAMLPPDEIRIAHQAWADFFLRQDQPHRLAARAAGHLFEAGEPSRAVSSAILAAKQAESQYAYREAGRWYTRVLPLVSDAERTHYLRAAARNFELADLPVEAADYYLELAQRVAADERIECRASAVKLLIRGGRIDAVRHQLRELTRELDLPRPKGPLSSRLSILGQVLRLEIAKRLHLRPRWVRAQYEHPLGQQCNSTDYDQQRLSLCLALARPLSMFDNLHAAELNLYAAQRLLSSTDDKSRMYLAIGSAVFDCYQQGKPRLRGETLLRDLRTRVIAFGDHELLADYWAAIAFSHMLACRWHLVCDRVEISVYHYSQLKKSHCYETSNTQAICFWSLWHLGQWNLLCQRQGAMLAEAQQRNDLVQQLTASTGLAASSWLIRDDPDESSSRHFENRRYLSNDLGPQYFDHMLWIDAMQRLIYTAQWERAVEHLASYKRLRHRSPLRKAQLLKVMELSFGALVLLHQLKEAPTPKNARKANRFISLLRAEKLDYTTTLAEMFQGLFWMLMGKPEMARQHLHLSGTQARQYRLHPIECASRDALQQINEGIPGNSLCDRMHEQGVVSPLKLERLYTVRLN